MPYRRTLFGAAGLAAALITAAALAQSSKPTPTPAPGTTPRPPGQPQSDMELVERVLAARRDYQTSLEELRKHYLTTGDVERARWAEDELIQYHRVLKQAYRLELDVPPPTLKPTYNIPEANELYKRAMLYKDKGWGGDSYIDNQRRAEILLQQLLTNHPQSDKIADAAYQLGELYEGKAYRQYRRAAAYYERSFQWNPLSHQSEARIRAARLYDRVLNERGRAIEIYKDIQTHETDIKRVQEAQKRLAELAPAAKQ